jgi:ubiquitin carboxyl-terminal hydrolase 14
MDVDAATTSAPAAAENQAPTEPEIDPLEGTRFTGFYDLVGVLTHKGRSADSGHYVSWVKQEDGSWTEFDDEKPIPRKEEEVLSLKGGGDFQMCYLMQYKARMV